MGVERSWYARGTARNPGPHLDRLPVALDFSGISFAEGLRASIASGLVLLLSLWLHSFPLLLVAFAANLTCFCDTGGLLATRIRALLVFTVVGALTWATFGVLRGFGWAVVIPFAGIVIFLCSMARVWGLAAQAVGNVLIVVLALAIDEPLDLQRAAVLVVSFVAGGLWAVLLTMAIWRINIEKPALTAVGHVWRNLARFSKDLRVLTLDRSATATDWEAHARAHRRATRAAIEDARPLIVAAARSRGPTAPLVRRALIRFEAAEQVFAALIALTDVIESAQHTESRHAATKLLRTIRPVFVLLQQSHLGRLERFGPVLTRAMELVRGEPELVAIVESMLDGIRVALRPEGIDQDAAASVTDGGTTRVTLQSLVAPFRDNLTWDSATLRHATRATVLTVPAIAWSLIWWTPYAHWLTITVALTMQPFFAATWQRVIERIGGTVLGGLIGAALAFLPQTILVKAVLLIPLCIIGFSVRQVSYGAYIACLTPLVVVLFDVAVPGHSDLTIAGMRLFFTVVGGLLALAACVVLWPTWEPDRLRQEMRTTLLAHARFADAVFATLLDGADRKSADGTRSAAGLANNNLEASLSRSLQEPRRSAVLEQGLVVDAAVRRIGGSLITLQHRTQVADQADRDALIAWRSWIVAGLTSLAEDRPIMDPAPPSVGSEALGRLRRAIELVAGVSERRLERESDAQAVGIVGQVTR